VIVASIGECAGKTAERTLCKCLPAIFGARYAELVAPKSRIGLFLFREHAIATGQLSRDSQTVTRFSTHILNKSADKQKSWKLKKRPFHYYNIYPNRRETERVTGNTEKEKEKPNFNRKKDTSVDRGGRGPRPPMAGQKRINAIFTYERRY